MGRPAKTWSAALKPSDPASAGWDDGAGNIDGSTDGDDDGDVDGDVSAAAGLSVPAASSSTGPPVHPATVSSAASKPASKHLDRFGDAASPGGTGVARAELLCLTASIPLGAPLRVPPLHHAGEGGTVGGPHPNVGGATDAADHRAGRADVAANEITLPSTATRARAVGCFGRCPRRPDVKRMVCDPCPIAGRPSRPPDQDRISTASADAQPSSMT